MSAHAERKENGGGAGNSPAAAIATVPESCETARLAVGGCPGDDCRASRSAPVCRVLRSHGHDDTSVSRRTAGAGFDSRRLQGPIEGDGVAQVSGGARPNAVIRGGVFFSTTGGLRLTAPTRPAPAGGSPAWSRRSSGGSARSAWSPVRPTRGPSGRSCGRSSAPRGRRDAGCAIPPARSRPTSGHSPPAGGLAKRS